MTTLTEASLTETERRTLDHLVELLKREFGSELRAVWLFGSRARGEQPRDESDVDLIVLGCAPHVRRWEYRIPRAVRRRRRRVASRAGLNRRYTL